MARIFLYIPMSSLTNRRYKMTYAQFEKMMAEARIYSPEEIEAQWQEYQYEQRIEAEETAHLNNLPPLE